MTERSAFYQSEIRATLGPTLRISGYAAVFNQLSDNLGGFREKIRPGAFADAIKDGDVRLLWNHDPNFVLARSKNNTLHLSEDDHGLKIDAELAETTFARDSLRLIERGDVDQMSFGFRLLPKGDEWRMEKDGTVTREILKVAELFDVSPVTFPAYPQTEVQARSLLAQEKIKELSIPDTFVDFKATHAAMRDEMFRKTWS